MHARAQGVVFTIIITRLGLGYTLTDLTARVTTITASRTGARARARVVHHPALLHPDRYPDYPGAEGSRSGSGSPPRRASSVDKRRVVDDVESAAESA